MSAPRRMDEIDWSGVRARLDAARRSVEQLVRPSDEQEREQLRARARELARPVATERPATERELISFRIGQEQYAIASRCVVEIFPMRELVPIPGVPAPIIGLASWRGGILVVSDLAELVGTSVESTGERRYVVVVGGAQATFGVPVDSVGDAIAADDRDVLPLPEGMAAKSELVTGVVQDTVLVLDDDALLRRHAQLS